MVSDFKRHFDGALALARMLGGKIAIADSKDAANNITKALEPVSDICNNVFTGFTDKKEEGEWVNVYTKERPTWQNWGSHDNAGKKDCAAMVVRDHE